MDTQSCYTFIGVRSTPHMAGEEATRALNDSGVLGHWLTSDGTSAYTVTTTLTYQKDQWLCIHTVVGPRVRDAELERRLLQGRV